MKAYVPTVLLLSMGCTLDNPDFCLSDKDCLQPEKPYCDVEGREGVGQKCIHRPSLDVGPDAGTPDTGIADAGPNNPDGSVDPMDGLLSVQLVGEGEGQVLAIPNSEINCPGVCSVDLPAETSLTLIAKPNDANSTFAGWSGACEGRDACQISIDGPVDVTATFGLVDFEVSVSLSGEGAGSVDSTPVGIDCGMACTATYQAKTQVTLTASAENESMFAGWTGACAGSGEVCTF